MRIIAGEFRSRRLETPRGLATRPTSDRLRETLFNVLGPRVQGAVLWDLYAGSGAVGLEALSRGAARCLFAERAAPALAALRANLASLGLTSRADIEPRGVARALAARLRDPRPADIVFLDPPYEAAAEYAATLSTLARDSAMLLAPGAVVVAEHSRKIALADRWPAAPAALVRTRLLEQGDAALSFYELSAGPETGAKSA